MKNISLIFVGFFLISVGVMAQKTIVISNTLPVPRINEMVEVKLEGMAVDFAHKQYVLKDANGKEVPYQEIMGKGKMPVAIIFQADVKANQSAEYKLSEGKPAPVKAKTFGRFVPERKDDFAWENDMAAYRMYGPALANENPSNGVDYWSKCTSELIVNKRYYDDLKKGIPYHIDHGTGLDFYKVAHTMGCGGIAPFVSGKLWIGNQFNTYKVLENGPLRTVFRLVYDSVKVGNDYLKEIITITDDAGSLLNKAVVRYAGQKGDMDIASGITLHDGKGNLKFDVAKGVVMYAENAVSDAGVPSGRNYVGVFVPSKVKEAKNQEDHGFLVATCHEGKGFTYYFGGGWSKWHFPTDEDWFKAVERFSLTHKHPLKITVK